MLEQALAADGAEQRRAFEAAACQRAAQQRIQQPAAGQLDLIDEDVGGDLMTSGPREVRAPRGAVLRCKGWEQEAALRMLMPLTLSR